MVVGARRGRSTTATFLYDLHGIHLVSGTKVGEPRRHSSPWCQRKHEVSRLRRGEVPHDLKSCREPRVSRRSRTQRDRGGRRAREGRSVVDRPRHRALDLTGDINSCTLFDDTSDVQLAHRLADMGLPAQHVGRLTYDFTPSAPGELHVRVPRPGSPALSVDGTVGNPATAGSFVANWGSGLTRARSRCPRTCWRSPWRSPTSCSRRIPAVRLASRSGASRSAFRSSAVQRVCRSAMV